MAAPTIIRGSDHFFVTTYEGNGKGQRVGKFVPFTDNGTIAKSCIFNDDDSPELSRTPSGAGNRDTFTLSFWIKRCSNLDALQIIFQHGADINNCTQLSFDSSNRLQYQQVDGGGNTDSLVTNRSFEDTSKFYHIVLAVDTTQSTEANRVRMYVDGDEITSWSTANYPSQNTDTDMNTTTEFSIGRQLSGTAYSPDCYFAEINHVDGTQYTPSTFGLTDTSTGRWIPKALTGISYGTNGFRLTFADSSALGDDLSGNTNDFTATNLASTDQTTDSPTSNHNNMGGSQNSGTTVAEGNLETTTPSGGTGYLQIVGLPAFGVNKGKWYWEVKVTTVGTGLYGWKDDGNAGGSIASNSGTIGSGGNFAGALSAGSSGSYSAGSWFVDHDYNNEVNYTTVATNDVLMFALDLDNNKGYCGKNGTWFNSADPANGTGAIGGTQRANGVNKFYPMCARLGGSASTGEWNFGQRSFAHTAPTGFSALQQDNLPETSKGISGLFWAKNRDQADSHSLYDSSRGQHLMLKSDSTSNEDTKTNGLQKFLKGGAEIEDHVGVNAVGESYVSWNWVANGGTTAANTNGSGASIASTTQANQTAGFSIVKYTGTGSAGTIAHGIGAAPTFIAAKNLDDSASWYVYINGSHSGDPNTLYMRFDSDDGQDGTGARWGDTTPTSSVFSVGGDDETNKNTKKFVAYCWADIPGYSRAGKYSGNGNADGQFIYTGFKPKLIMIKGLNIGNNWIVWDTERSKINPCDDALYWDLAQAAATSGNDLDILSNGFKCRGTNSNYNGSYSYGYLAFAENPFVGDGTNPTTAR